MMKKIFYRTICLLLLSAFSFGNSQAQMKELISKPLYIGMTVPRDFCVSTDTKEKFVASGNGISVAIQPYIPAGSAHNNMTSALIQQAESLGYSDLSNVETIELNGFKGCYATGKGDEKGKILAILLMNHRRKQHLFVLIPYPARLEKTALYIANSFYAE